ncbi:hypothetical protein [Peptoniphilus genitalis]|uniref:hypothetical protein n=1 Tax=Peptoniphilus genitalis TaxID=3036303 RepID=UPI0024ACEBF5|nr:hypothetical protein [Peptoniphilus sp. Marseille-Q7072]
MQNNNNMNLLGFKDVVFDSFDENNDFVHVNASVTKVDTCPHCASKIIGFMIIEFKRLRILTFMVRNVLFI